MPVEQGRYKKKDMDLQRFFNGGMAGVLGKTFIAPIERVKYIFVVGSADQ